MNKAGRPASKIDPEKTWQCILCKKHFTNGVGFRAHHADVFEPGERCLTALELRAFGFSTTKAGVWHAGIEAETNPVAISRLIAVKAPGAGLMPTPALPQDPPISGVIQPL